MVARRREVRELLSTLYTLRSTRSISAFVPPRIEHERTKKSAPRLAPGDAEAYSKKGPVSRVELNDLFRPKLLNLLPQGHAGHSFRA